MKQEKKTHDSSFLYNGVKFSIHTRTRFSLKCININLYFWEIYNTQQTLLHPILTMVHLACRTWLQFWLQPQRLWELWLKVVLFVHRGCDRCNMNWPTVVGNWVVSSFQGASMAAAIRLCWLGQVYWLWLHLTSSATNARHCTLQHCSLLLGHGWTTLKRSS